MKRIVLAKLTAKESDTIQEMERWYNTFRTLMENQFIDSKEKTVINQKRSEMLQDLKQTYKIILKKYQVPYISNLKYSLDPHRDELYIEVYQ